MCVGGVGVSMVKFKESGCPYVTRVIDFYQNG